MLVAQKITKDINGRRILNGVDVIVRPGTATAIIGPNGAGKSMLIRAISLIDPPTTGRVVIDGSAYEFPSAMPFSAPPWPDLTIVFQQLFLWPHLTLRENIILPASRRFDQREYQKYLDRLIKIFEISNVIDQHPNEASLGERQRAAIIRALILRPKYLFLDEITSALDVEQIQRLLELMVELKSDNVGILMVTHLLGFAKQLSDKILFMENGLIVEAGDQDIVDHPNSDRMKRFMSLVSD